MADFHYFNLDDHSERDQPLIFSCNRPGLADLIGLKPAPSAAHELVRDTFLTNLALAGQAEKALSYSRHRGFYKRSRYRLPAFTYTNVMRAAAEIVREGLGIETRTRPGHRGRQSTITATDALMTHWRDLDAEPVYDSAAETIILKSRDEERRLLEYVDSPSIRAKRDQVRPINEMLNSLDLEVHDGTQVARNLLLFEKAGSDKQGRPTVKRHFVRLSHKAGKRIFAGDFEHHGRFYCAPQNIPGDARRTMQINGERCAEFDFSAMHPRLAYNLAGIPLDGDPYDIGKGFERQHVKLGVLIVFNAANPLSAIHALVRDDDMQISYALAKKIVEAIFERHGAIRRMLCADAGIKLMNLDATIMMDVLEALVARGIPCIGIHDSVVVPERFGGDAQAEMEKFWALHSKGPTPCEIKGKPAILPHMREMRLTSGVS